MYIDFAKLSSTDRELFKEALIACGYLPATIPFSEEIPLDGSYIMEERVIDAGTSFYPKGNRNQHGSCYLRLVGNGSISPNFWGMSKDINSSDYRTEAGVVNFVYIWYDGTQVCYRITCANDTGINRAAVASAAVNFNIGNRVEITFTHNLSQKPVPSPKDFAVTYNGIDLVVSAVVIDDDDNNKVFLALNTEIDYNGECHISYISDTTNPLTDSEGFSIVSFTDVTASRPD